MIAIRTFGGLHVMKGAQIVCTDLGSVTGELLAYLAVNTDAVHRRERIAEQFWPEKSAARSRASLNTAIWRINESLKGANILRHVSICRISDSTIAAKLGAGVVVDCTALSTTVSNCEQSLSRTSALSAEARRGLRMALTGAQSDFLDGLDSDWVIRARERYRCQYARGMTILMCDYARAGRIEEALDCGRAILDQDEFREVTQRAVMWLHVMNGQRGEAIAQYRKLVSRLAAEIGVKPMAETTSLYEDILSDAAAAEVTSRAGITVRPSITKQLRAQGEHRITVFETIVSPEMALP